MKNIYETLVICGRYFEHMDFLDGIKCGKREGAQPVKGKRKQNKIRLDSLLRTKQKLRRLIWCNENRMKTFITLTFKENFKDLQMANVLFQNFIKKMTYRFCELAYIGAPEFQKRGAVHYHLLTNVPYISNEDVSSMWVHGFVTIKAVTKECNMARYLTKYLTKDSASDDDRFFNKKKIFYSKNICKPEILRDPKDIKARLDYYRPTLKQLYEQPLKIDFVGPAIYKLFESIVSHEFVPTTKEEFDKKLRSMLDVMNNSNSASKVNTLKS